MRYFVYISEAKLEMLAPQLPWRYRRRHGRRTRTWNVGARPLVASASVGGERVIESSLIERLVDIEKHIERSGDVGGVNDSSSWIRGDVDMRWGSQSEEATAVFFWAEWNQRMLLLGGSAHHVIGSGIPELQRLAGDGPSSLPAIAVLLAAWQAWVPPARRKVARQEDQDDERLASRLGEQALHFAATSRDVPPQRLQFLARRLADFVATSPESGDCERKPVRVTVGTPLYVELANAASLVAIGHD